MAILKSTDRATTRGHAESWALCAGVVCSFDPRLMLRLPAHYRVADFALEAALVAAVTAGQESLPLYHLASRCRVPQVDLVRMIPRVKRVTARVEGKQVRIEKMQRWVAEQALYWRFPLEDMAAAPSVLHLLAWFLFATAAASRGSDGVLGTEPAELARWLCLRTAEDAAVALMEPDAARNAILALANQGFARRRSPKPRVSGGTGENRRAQVADVSSVFDWVAQRFPHHELDIGPNEESSQILVAATEQDCGEVFEATRFRIGFLSPKVRQAYTILDGVVRGHHLSVNPILAAKVWQHAQKRRGIRTPFREIRWLWLSSVSAWAAGSPDPVPFWSAQDFERELAERTATETFVAFATRAVDDARDGGSEGGLLWRLRREDGRTLEQQRVRRWQAMRAGTEVVVGRDAEGAPLTQSAWEAVVADIERGLRSSGRSQAEVLAAVAEAQETMLKRRNRHLPVVAFNAGIPVPRNTYARKIARVPAEQMLAAIPYVVAGYELPAEITDEAIVLASEVVPMVVNANARDFSAAASGRATAWEVIKSLAGDELLRATRERQQFRARAHALADRMAAEGAFITADQLIAEAVAYAHTPREQAA